MRNSTIIGLTATVSCALTAVTTTVARQSAFAWPQEAPAALSLSFDDARPSQLTAGLPVFTDLGVRVTFYLTASSIGEHAGAWRRAAGAGHELANHSLTHPCSGNFAWARARALEDYTLDRIRAELLDANQAIEGATGVRPLTFAYPCGQTFVGRGSGVRSYVPLVHELFLAGRGWRGEAPNDPEFVDLSQVFGYPMDDVEFGALRPVLDAAISNRQWLVLAGHDIGDVPAPQLTRVVTLRALVSYAREKGMWIDTVAAVARHVKASRGL